MNETALRRWLKMELEEVPLTFVEPSLGSTTGAPDVWVPTRMLGMFVPVELKVASFGRQGRITPLNVRPVQIGWHERMHRANAWTYLLLGILGATGWMAWVLDDCSRAKLMHWQKGFAQEELAQVAVDDKLDKEKWWRALGG